MDTSVHNSQRQRLLKWTPSIWSPYSFRVYVVHSAGITGYKPVSDVAGHNSADSSQFDSTQMLLIGAHAKRISPLQSVPCSRSSFHQRSNTEPLDTTTQSVVSLYHEQYKEVLTQRVACKKSNTQSSTQRRLNHRRPLQPAEAITNQKRYDNTRKRYDNTQPTREYRNAQTKPRKTKTSHFRCR